MNSHTIESDLPLHSTWVAKAVNAGDYTYKVFDDVLLVAVMKDGHICELCERNTWRGTICINETSVHGSNPCPEFIIIFKSRLIKERGE